MKAVIYARVSTEQQEDQKTIESQISELQTCFAQSNDTLIDKYIDNGYSGAMLARPALDRLRDDARNHLFDRVYIHNPDRLARRYAYQELILDELQKLQIEVVFKDRKSAGTPEDQMLQGFQGLFAEYEKTKIVERTRRGRLHRAKSNHIVGHLAPYGYDNIKRTETSFATYVINEKEAEVVRQIFAWLTEEQLTLYKIICRLKSQGITARKGGMWARSSLSRLLRNETYTGTTYYNKQLSVPSTKPRVDGVYSRQINTSRKAKDRKEWIGITVPAIISKETYNKAQKQLAANSLLADRNAKYNYLLKGLVYCGNDEGRLYGVPIHGTRYYRCRFKGKVNAVVPCQSIAVKADNIEKTVWDEISMLLSSPTQVKLQYERWIQKLESKTVGNRALINRTDLESDKNKLKEEENRLLIAYSSGFITLEQLKSQNDRIQSQKAILATKEEQNDSSEQLYNNITPKKHEFMDYAKLFTNVLAETNLEQKTHILRMTVKRITVKDKQLIIKGVLPSSSDVLLSSSPHHRGSAW
ncbi:MAG: recombinase family protein [bacterium]